MIRYFLNWMGPVANRWYTERGLDFMNPKDLYATGRIDISKADEPYNIEYGVSPMKRASWAKLGDWLMGLKTEDLISKKELFMRFEEETGHIIEWWEE